MPYPSENLAHVGCYKKDEAEEKQGDNLMLSWAITFLVIALIAGVVGLSGVAGAATNIAWIIFVLFLIIFAASFITGRRPPA